MNKKTTVAIPIEEAKHIAHEYGYDQVIIIAREHQTKGMEHVTTFGHSQEDCDVAARIGDHIKFDIMKWESEIKS